jgi:hypothetical protein
MNTSSEKLQERVTKTEIKLEDVCEFFLFLVMLLSITPYLIVLASKFYELCHDNDSERDTTRRRLRRRRQPLPISQRIIVTYIQVHCDDDGSDPVESLCCICYEMGITTRFQPCGHSELCLSCCAKMFVNTNFCPLCRANVQIVYFWNAYGR